MPRFPCPSFPWRSITLAAAAQAPDAPPKSYDCYRTPTPIHIDGKLDDPAWKSAPWTTDFVDIQGSAKPKPRFRTRIKMLWDDNYLYIAAELEEPDVKATLTQHDSVIFHDNDFELFLKPLPGAPATSNSRSTPSTPVGTSTSTSPTAPAASADNSWDIPGLKTAVAVQGTLNQSTDKDHGWTVEIAIPWSAYTSRLPVPRPQPGYRMARQLQPRRVAQRHRQQRRSTAPGAAQRRQLGLVPARRNQHARPRKMGLPPLPRPTLTCHIR